MKRIWIIAAVLLLCTSCATIFCGSKKKITLENDEVTAPVELIIDNQRYTNVYFPTQVKVKRGFRATQITAKAKGYEDGKLTVHKTFNPIAIINLTNLIAWGIDAGTGAMMKPDAKSYYIPMQRKQVEPANYVELPNRNPEPTERVSHDNAGQSDLERTVVRWYFDSDPRGARIFWRVISSIPAEVKNTNETYLMTTPFEETRSFNILGLTYENSRDVQIEIKVSKKGYEDQIKRFNVRQAIDQQEISGFFEMVAKEQHY